MKIFIIAALLTINLFAADEAKQNNSQRLSQEQQIDLLTLKWLWHAASMAAEHSAEESDKLGFKKNKFNNPATKIAGCLVDHAIPISVSCNVAEKVYNQAYEAACEQKDKLAIAAWLVGARNIDCLRQKASAMVLCCRYELINLATKEAYLEILDSFKKVLINKDYGEILTELKTFLEVNLALIFPHEPELQNLLTAANLKPAWVIDLPIIREYLQTSMRVSMPELIDLIIEYVNLGLDMQNLYTWLPEQLSLK